MSFDEGFSRGISSAEQDKARKNQRADEEHALKINDLIQQRQALVQKIPTLVDEKGQPTPEYVQTKDALQKVNLDLADAYHPAKYPGAVQKLGHLLTDHVGLTSAKDRDAKQATQQQTKQTAAGQAADRQIAAAPLSAAQLNTQKMRAQLDEIDKSSLDEEGKKAARAKVFGVTTAVKPNWQQFKLPNGTLRSYDLNKPDEIPPDATEVPKGAMTAAKETIAGYDEAVKNGYTGSYPQYVAEERRKGAPSTSALNEYAASYQKAYGIKPEEMTPADWDFIQRKMAYDKAIPQTTTTNTTKQNSENQWVPIQETNTKSPGGGAPAPPRGKPKNNVPPPSQQQVPAVASPAGNASAPAGVPSAPPASPRALKEEAKKRAPKGSSDNPATSRATGANASVKVGDPLFAAPNKEYNDAKTAYDGAVHRKTLMHKNLQDALKDHNQQAMLSLVANHIGMTLGAQKGARINQSVWNEAVASRPWLDGAIAKFGPDGYLSGVTLSPEQMKQMVALADESTDVTKEDMDRIKARMNEGVQNPSKSPAGGGNGETVKMKAPNGQTKDVPKDQVDHYKKMGATVVQ